MAKKIYINTTIDERLISAVDKVAQNRSVFIDQALREKLDRL